MRDASPTWHRLAQARPRLGFGVGIAQGYATLGRIGFEGRFDYAAIGTVTNLAAASATRRRGQILVTERVLAQVERVPVRVGKR